MMRKWLYRKASTPTLEDDLKAKGFIFEEGCKWWWHKILKVAVSEEDVLKHPLAVLATAPCKYKFGNVTFLSTKTLNRDILDTLYVKFFKGKHEQI